MIALPHRPLLLLALVIALLAGCAGATPSATPPPRSTPEPATYWPTAGWRTSTPEEQGVDSSRLAAMLDTIAERGYDIHSLTVVRNGYLVADAYFHPFSRDTKHSIHSCTKSVISALIGIAIQLGYIQEVEQPVLSFFPERTVNYLDAAKEAITLEHLLTMSSGLRCHDSYLYDWRGLNQMRASDDWVQFVLDLPMAEAPGTRFEYCNGGSYLLSAILQQTTGSNVLVFAREHLFGPLGITDVRWPASPQGVNIGWGEMHLTPHDMAKLGYLYLNHGRWEDRQIVPAAWVAASTTAHVIAGTLSDAYGYLWWVDAAGYYMALGYAGQFIFVVPERKMVVAFTGALEGKQFNGPETLLNEFIIPAAASSGPLPPNPDGVERLKARMRAAAHPQS